MSLRTRARALERACAAEPDADVTWLEAPPAGYGRFAVTTPVPGVTLARAGSALRGWSLHRSAGLRVVALRPACTGDSVVVGVPFGPLAWAAPCRVLEVVERADRVAFTYATLAGHPEHGVERFTMRGTADGVTFEVEAVSRPSLAVVRVLPRPAEWIQARVTERYLRAARELGTA